MEHQPYANKWYWAVAISLLIYDIGIFLYLLNASGFIGCDYL